MSGLLGGIVVVEMAQVITGPMAGMLLAELGADVVKVEPPGTGDSFRRWEGGKAETDVPASFAAYNRGKRSVTLDTRTERGRDVYRTLVDRADVVIENFRPGVLDGAGIGPLALRERNPRLVYCSITGAGPVGPRASAPVFDAVAQARSGLWSQFSDLERPEPVGPPMADQLTAMYAALAVAAAIERRHATGVGCTLEVSMLGACMAFQTLAITGLLAGEPAPDRRTRARRSLTFAFHGSDGLPFCIHLSSPQKFWESLCGAIGQPALASDQRFAAKRDRTDAYEELRAVLQETFGTRTRNEWLRRLDDCGVPAAPIFDLGEVVADPQVVAIEMLVPGDEDGTTVLGSAISVDGHRCRSDGPAPSLGIHTDEVLRELGFDGVAIAGLRAEGAV
jgi:crotonobetainyl-CoA:carnitine CoA-transferase CaiB-like acyl-CoA transferase